MIFEAKLNLNISAWRNICLCRSKNEHHMEYHRHFHKLVTICRSLHKSGAEYEVNYNEDCTQAHIIAYK